MPYDTHGADREVNRAFIVRGQYKSSMLNPVCLRQEDEGSAATQVLCPEANGVRHYALAIHLYVRPHAYYMNLITAMLYSSWSITVVVGSICCNLSENVKFQRKTRKGKFSYGQENIP